MKSWGMFINGEYCQAASGKTFPVFKPSNDEALRKVAEGGQADIVAAVKCGSPLGITFGRRA